MEDFVESAKGSKLLIFQFIIMLPPSSMVGRGEQQLDFLPQAPNFIWLPLAWLNFKNDSFMKIWHLTLQHFLAGPLALTEKCPSRTFNDLQKEPKRGLSNPLTWNRIQHSHLLPCKCEAEMVYKVSAYLCKPSCIYKTQVYKPTQWCSYAIWHPGAHIF